MFHELTIDYFVKYTHHEVLNLLVLILILFCQLRGMKAVDENVFHYHNLLLLLLNRCILLPSES